MTKLQKGRTRTGQWSPGVGRGCGYKRRDHGDGNDLYLDYVDILGVMLYYSFPIRNHWGNWIKGNWDL